MAYIATLNLLRGVLTGDDAELQPFRQVIEGYILAYRKTDPFDGLPSETRLHLERLHDALQDKAHLLEPLTMQLKELVSVYEREKKAQSRYTTGGFILAIVGLAFAGYTYLYPYSPALADKSLNSPAKTLAPK
jgi:dolichol kinase